MCMIAHRTLNDNGRGSNIPNEVIDTAMRRHKDGFGIAWRDDLGLRYEKFGPSETGDFRKLLKAVDKDREIEYVAHFRFATQGPPCRVLSHPYSYIDENEGEVLVFHNGVIDIAAQSTESDTEVFVRNILAKLPSAWWRQQALRDLVDMAAGWSKLVLMTNAETVNLNRDKGTVDGGIWYSSDHKPWKWATGKTTGYSDYSPYDNDDYMRDWHQTEPGVWVKDDGASKSAKDSAVVLYANPVGNTQPMANKALWQHQGHILTPLMQFDFSKDGDYAGAIICDECQTIGDVYIVDGRAYPDLDHRYTIDDDLLPGERAKIKERLAGVTTDGKVVQLP